jgi:hypothetical protein
MVLADAAATATIGLLITFIGIGLIANAIIVFILAQVRGERRENQEYLKSRGDEPAGSEKRA